MVLSNAIESRRTGRGMEPIRRLKCEHVTRPRSRLVLKERLIHLNTYVLRFVHRDFPDLPVLLALPIDALRNQRSLASLIVKKGRRGDSPFAPPLDSRIKLTLVRPFGRWPLSPPLTCAYPPPSRSPGQLWIWAGRSPRNRPRSTELPGWHPAQRGTC